MKKLLIALSLLSFGAQAAPFLYADSTADEVEVYFCKVDSGADISITPITLADGKKQLRYDLATLTSGSHTIVCRAEAPKWSLVSPNSAPFSLVKPSALGTPLNLLIGVK